MTLLAGRRVHALTLTELHEALSRRGVRASFSSVFRAVEHLEREGRVARVDLGDGRSRFEAAGPHHDHLRCESCGRIEALPRCPVTVDPPAPRGWYLHRHALVVSGLCPGCARG